MVSTCLEGGSGADLSDWNLGALALLGGTGAARYIVSGGSEDANELLTGLAKWSTRPDASWLGSLDISLEPI